MKTKIPQIIISRSSEWNSLKLLAKKKVFLRQEFKNKDRVNRMSGWLGDLFIDRSRALLNRSIEKALLALAQKAGIIEQISEMFNGKKINLTENRAALHVALRASKEQKIYVDNQNVVLEVQAVLKKMEKFTDSVQNGVWRGYTGKKIDRVISIGIGGSDLGPRMACRALKHYADKGIEVKFVSNVDPTDLAEVLEESNPQTTLFVIQSKTFTTIETLTNAQAAKDWLIKKLGNKQAVAKHFVAVSANQAGVIEFGIDRENMFEFWDWVGGRYSMTGAVGLPIMLAIGCERFQEMLEGFRLIDEHYKTSPLEKNLPVLLALDNIWYANFLGFQAHAVLPYDQYLELFPKHLQQLLMESLGKRINKTGLPLDFSAGAVILDGIGTNGQHSFFQSLQQGAVVPVDFIGFANSLNPLGRQQESLIANLLAQAKTLAFGINAAELKAAGTEKLLIEQKVHPGNRPSLVILAEKLTPKILGELIALYEHTAHAWGTILGINPFDQFGVEQAKKAAGSISKEIEEGLRPDEDPATADLLKIFKKLHKIN